MQSISYGTLKGIDVSNWQGNIDFNQVKSNGVQVVYIKASEGDYYKDIKLEQNYTGAKAAGLMIGFYHFFRPSTEADALAEAQFFANTIGNKIPDCRLALDLEVTGGLTPSFLSTLADIFLKEIKRLTGKEVVLYTYTSFAQTSLTTLLSKYPLWIAHYGVTQPGNNPIWNSWIGFQYSSTGTVPGISGDVDLNVFTNNILLNSVTPIPPVKPPTPVAPNGRLVYYTVQSGDTLDAIASKYGTTTNSIISLNNISNPNYIYVGQILKLYSSSSVNSSLPPLTPQSTTYIIKSGDTLSGIAAKFNTTTSALVQLNNISNPNFIYPGEVIRITGNSSPNTLYTVQYGDTLSGIAAKFNTTTSILASINGIKNSNLIYVGQVLKINNSISNIAPKNQSYTIQYGDTLSGIAAKFNTTTSYLMGLNKIYDANKIYAGEVILI